MHRPRGALNFGEGIYRHVINTKLARVRVNVEELT